MSASHRPISRPGGRAAVVVASVHRAARELLNEVGYEGLQLPDVAERAHVNKTTVYRRWPTKADLVSDVLLSLTNHDFPATDTGNLLDDLIGLLRDITDLLATPLVQAILRVSLDGAIDPQTRRAFWDERNRRSSLIIDRAIRRGELPPGTDPRALFEHASSTIYFRQLVTGEPVTEPDLRLFAERAIQVARA